MFSLDGLNAFVTGGAAGIGLGVTTRFLEAGARVVIADRDEGDAASIGATFVRADVSKEADVETALKQASELLGDIDIVVNNAGITHEDRRIEDTLDDDLRNVFETDAYGVFYGLKHAPRHMRDGGAIINTASLTGIMPSNGRGPYAAAKAAVMSMTQTAAIELGERGIRVNAVAPGTIRTAMLPPDHFLIKLSENLCPLRRLGEVEDIVGIFHFLAAPESRYMTGQTVTVDGGRSIGWSSHAIEKLNA